MVTGFRGVTDHARSAPKNTPYIDRIELRAGVDNLDNAQKEYRLRVYPRPWGETKYSRQLLSASQKAYELEQKFYLGEALKQRYKVVLEYIECTQRLKSNKALQKVYTDRATVLQKKIASQARDDVGSLISTEDKRIALRLDIIELENRIAELEKTITRLAGYDSDIAFSDADLIDMAQIKSIVEGLNPSVIENNINLERKRCGVEIANYRVAVEKAKGRDYLNYLQVGHTVDTDDDWQKSVSFEVGLRLPFTNSSREAVWQRQAALQQERYYYNQDKAAVSEASAHLQRHIKLLLSQYDLLGAEQKRNDAVNAMRMQITAKGGGPLELLKLNESLLENELQFNRVAFLIRSSFIDLLDLAGLLTDEPLVDYLSNNLARL